VQQAFGFLVGIAVLLAIAVFFVITILWAWGHLLEMMAPPTASTLFNWSGQSMVGFIGKLQASHEDDVQSAGGTLPSCCSIQLQSHYHNFQCSLCTWSTFYVWYVWPHCMSKRPCRTGLSCSVHPHAMAAGHYTRDLRVCI
jgi:hypothetical protein